MPSACAPTCTDISAATHIEPMEDYDIRYRIVWHSRDPMNENRLIGPGTVDDYMILRELPEPSNENHTHILYFQYNGWKAELNCRSDYDYDDNQDYIRDWYIRDWSINRAG